MLHLARQRQSTRARVKEAFSHASGPRSNHIGDIDNMVSSESWGPLRLGSYQKKAPNAFAKGASTSSQFGRAIGEDHRLDSKGGIRMVLT
jgi:hypothetical protein